MNLAELLDRIAKGENLHTEFKERLPQPDDLATEMVAFANTDGGEILIGVSDKGRVVGVEELDRVMQTVDNIAYHNCEPPVTVVQETVKEEARIALVVHVPKGAQRPYRTNRGIYYIRTTSGKRQASREELLRLFQATESLYYDETPMMWTSMMDIEAQALNDVLQIAGEQGFDVGSIDQERLLRNWRLLREIDGQTRLTLAGALFLARHPQHFLPYAYVSALRISGTEISNEPLDQKRIEGRLLSILEDTRRFLYIYLRRPHRIQGLEPEVHPELPEEVLREALVNALSHRDYTISAPIRVIVFDDRVEVRTPGQLPNTVTLESLAYGIHVLRNPILYSMFLRIGLVTDAGSGIPRMIRLIRQATKKEPVFRLEGNEFVVSLPREDEG